MFMERSITISVTIQPSSAAPPAKAHAFAWTRSHTTLQPAMALPMPTTKSRNRPGHKNDENGECESPDVGVWINAPSGLAMSMTPPVTAVIAVDRHRVASSQRGGRGGGGADVLGRVASV